MLRQVSGSLFKCVSSRVSSCSRPCLDLKQRPLEVVKYSQNLGLYNSCKHYSMYSIRFEERKAIRPLPPKDETPHLPQYMNEGLKNQEDTEETRQISADVIQNINSQILEKSHGRLFAVVLITGKQFKVTEEDIIVLQGHWAPNISDRIRFEKVLLTGGSNFTVVGRPTLPRDLVRIEGTVIEKTLSYTKLHFRLLRRKNYRRLYFSKTPYTMVRINSIEFEGLVNERKEIEGERNTIY